MTEAFLEGDVELAGVDVLTLRHGAGSTTSLAYAVFGEHYVVTTANGGRTELPAWFDDLRANPTALVEVGDESFEVRAVVGDAERGPLLNVVKEHPVLGPHVEHMESLAERSVDLVRLDRVDMYEKKNRFNQEIIEEFRSNEGQLNRVLDGGVDLANVPMLLLHTVGRKTGEPRVNPLGYRTRGDAYVVFATNGGSSHDPHWYLNLMASPETTIELADRTIEVRARLAEGEEREEIMLESQTVRWNRPGRYGGYERYVTREIPVVLLVPSS